MSSGDTYEDSESELQQSSSENARVLGQLPDNNRQQRDTQETSSRVTEDSRQFSSGKNNHHKGQFRVTEDMGQLSLDKNNHQQQDPQETSSEAILDRKKTEREREAHSRNLSPSEEQSAPVTEQLAPSLPDSESLDTKGVVGDLKWVMDELAKYSVFHLIKGVFVVWLIQKLARDRRNVPFHVQEIDEYERVNREKTRQGFLRGVMPVFVIWVIVGLVMFALTGNFWLLLATPALGIILRKATKHYFSLSEGSSAVSSPPSSKSSWWRKLFRAS